MAGWLILNGPVVGSAHWRYRAGVPQPAARPPAHRLWKMCGWSQHCRVVQQGKTGRVALRVTIFGTPIEHQYGVPAKAGMQAAISSRGSGAGRIIGVSQKHHAGGLCHCLGKGVNINDQLGFAHGKVGHPWHGSQVVNQKCMLVCNTSSPGPK